VDVNIASRDAATRERRVQNLVEAYVRQIAVGQKGRAVTVDGSIVEPVKGDQNGAIFRPRSYMKWRDPGAVAADAFQTDHFVGAGHRLD
jgi:hypothetical protein